MIGWIRQWLMFPVGLDWTAVHTKPDWAKWLLTLRTTIPEEISRSVRGASRVPSITDPWSLSFYPPSSKSVNGTEY